jgi:DNA-binding LacI/PurR family transcriptional regulator
MQDVARTAGVSAQTVSNVINGRTDRVGAETIDRVVRVIDELGYRLNQSARSLRRGRTGLVGLGVPVLASDYYGELSERLALRFAAHGIRFVTENTGGAIAGELETLAASHLETYDGFILAIAASESADLSGISPTKPILLLGERALSATFDHVLMDNIGASAIATGHLLDRGARRVAVLGGARTGPDSVETLRTRGYVLAHEERQQAVSDELILRCDLDIVSGYRAVRRALEGGIRFDGLFALTDSLAFGAMRALLEAGQRIPADVRVVGFDNVRFDEFSTPSLTSIEPGNDEMADEIVAAMMRRLTHPDSSFEPRRVIAAPTLVLRESSP